MEELVCKLIYESGIHSISDNDVRLQLLSHTDYPSLKAITDTLDYFSVENITANVPKDVLHQLPQSFLALVQTSGEKEIIHVTQKNNGIYIIDQKGKRSKSSISNFSTTWTGTLIAIEISEQTKKTKFKKLSLPSLLALLNCIALLILVFQKDRSIFEISYIVLSFLGLVISGLIIKEGLGKKNSFTTKVCGLLSPNSDGCSNVIKHKIKILGKTFGFGDLSMIYFLSSLLLLILFGIEWSAAIVLAGVSIPIVIYTIFKQAIVLKQWCALCLLISSIIVFQSILAITSHTSWDLTAVYGSTALLIFTSLFLVWLTIEPLITAKIEFLNTKKDLLRLKKDPLILKSILNEYRRSDLKKLTQQNTILFGNPSASIKLVGYTNPFCGFCKEAFTAYQSLLKRYPNEVSIQLLFSTPEDSTNPSYIISRQIINIYTRDKDHALLALQNWFESRDINKWNNEFLTIDNISTNTERILKAHRDISLINHINYTPETFIDNIKLSRKHFLYEDIPVIVDYIKDSLIIQEEQVNN